MANDTIMGTIEGLDNMFGEIGLRPGKEIVRFVNAVFPENVLGNKLHIPSPDSLLTPIGQGLSNGWNSLLSGAPKLPTPPNPPKLG